MPHALVYLLPGGLKAHPVRPEVSQAREDERRLIAMQLPYLERDDSTPGVHKDGEREYRFHSEGCRGFQATPLPQKDGIVHLHVVNVFRNGIAIIDGNSNDFEPVSSIFAADSLEKRDLSAAGLAPGSPEIHRQRPAPPVRKGVSDARQVRKRKVGRSLGEGTGLRASILGRGAVGPGRCRQGWCWLECGLFRTLMAAQEKTGGSEARENPRDRQHGGGRTYGVHGGD